jgi:hypothetical protein
MKKINTGFIVDPSITQPFNSGSLDFLQDWIQEGLEAAVRSIVGLDYLTGTPYAVFGLEYTGSVNTPSIVNNGIIYRGGQLYRAIGGGPISTGAVFNIATTSAGSIEFTDGVVRNPLDTTNATLADQTLGTGTFNLSDVVYLQVGTKVSLATTATLINSYTGTLKYFKDNEGFVRFQGSVNIVEPRGSTNFFTLPVGFRPTNNKVFAAITQNSSLYPGLITITSAGVMTFNSSSPGSGSTTVYLDGIEFNVGW